MSNENLEVSAPSLSNQTDYRNRQGVHPTESGKWGATILHPITKVSIWLGIYDNPKEAAVAYMNKKEEYRSLLVNKTQDFVNTKLGIQGAKIQDPGNNESESLGTSNSSQTYVNAYSREMLEFDSLFTNAYVKETENALNRKTCEAKFMHQTEMSFTESKLHVKDDVIAQSSKITNQLSVDLAEAAGNSEVALDATRMHGSGSIYRSNSGMWRAQIYSRSSRVHVGVYSTYDETEAAIHKKRQDLDSVVHVEVVSKKGAPTATRKQLTSVACDQHHENELNVIRPRVMPKLRGSVGKYDTTEKAFEVLNRKRGEFALLKDTEKKCKQTTDADVEDLQSLSGTTANCHVELIECKGGETALSTKSQDIECGDCSSNMEDIQVPCSSIVSNQEFDTSIVNAYGQLVGEYSRLDDDLWLMESLDDVDEN